MNTFYAVWTATSDVNTIVLIREDAEGITEAKFVDYDSDDSIYSTARRMETITGERYRVVLISRERFKEKFGRRLARGCLSPIGL